MNKGVDGKHFCFCLFVRVVVPLISLSLPLSLPLCSSFLSLLWSCFSFLLSFFLSRHRPPDRYQMILSAGQHGARDPMQPHSYDDSALTALLAVSLPHMNNNNNNNNNNNVSRNHPRKRLPTLPKPSNPSII